VVASLILLVSALATDVLDDGDELRTERPLRGGQTLAA
jgi:hypothetical protein